MPNNTQRFGVLQGFISDVLLGEQDLSLVIDLVDLGGPLLLPDSPLNNIAKRNFKYIISEDEACKFHSELS
jgi:hypothetical protein